MKFINFWSLYDTDSCDSSSYTILSKCLLYLTSSKTVHFTALSSKLDYLKQLPNNMPCLLNNFSQSTTSPLFSQPLYPYFLFLSTLYSICFKYFYCLSMSLLYRIHDQQVIRFKTYKIFN